MLERLLRERADHIAKMSAIHKTAEEEDRDLTEAEATEFDGHKEAVKALTTRIERAEAMRETERAIQPLEIERENLNQDPEDAAATAGQCGFSDLADFALSVQGACRRGATTIDERLANIPRIPTAAAGRMAAPANFHQEQGTEEGYMVPPAFRDMIWELVFQLDDLLAMTDNEPTSSNTVQHLRDESTPWDATGVQARWRAEGTQMIADKLSTKMAQMQLHELYAFVLATGELLEDAPRLANRLTVKAAQALRWKISDSVLYGTGAGQPFGYVNSNAVVSVAKESGQAADTFVTANAAKMFSRLLGDSIGRAIWLANSDVLPQLLVMTLGNQPIWTAPSQGFQQAPGGFLLGRPVRLTEHARTLGDKGDVQFVDLQGYYSAQKAQTQFARSIHLFFDYNIEAFRWIFRFGGQPHMTAPVTPANGVNTKSHFVLLDERA